jgi:hypothetical protein
MHAIWPRFTSGLFFWYNGHMEKKEGHPFVSLENSDLKGNLSKLFCVPGREDLVVRKSFVNVPREKTAEMTVHEKAEYLQNRVVEFKKIIDRTGIRMAKTDYVIGKDPATDNPAIFGAVERIEGKSLHELTSLDKDTAKKVDELYAKIISELVDSYLNYGYFWFDSNNEQFVLGKANGDESPDIYLVDADPHIFKWGPPDLYPEEREAVLWGRLDMVVGEMEEMENKVDEKGFKFARSRQTLDRVINETPSFV